jgi:hypothetical protein
LQIQMNLISLFSEEEVKVLQSHDCWKGKWNQPRNPIMNRFETVIVQSPKELNQAVRSEALNYVCSFMYGIDINEKSTSGPSWNSAVALGTHYFGDGGTTSYTPSVLVDLELPYYSHV